MDAKGLIILLVVITSLTAIVLYWYNIQLSMDIPPNSLAHVEKTQGLGATIYEKGSNPLASGVVETNPLKDTVTNPFDTYHNPFATQ